jgi:glycosyltransferase involved in cell wall biosynthesis
MSRIGSYSFLIPHSCFSRRLFVSENTEISRAKKSDEINTPPRPVKALFVEHDLDLGGAERVLETVLKTANRSILQPVIALLGRKGLIAGELERSGITVYDHLNIGNYDPRGSRKLTQISKKENADIIYCSDMPMAMMYSWLATRPSGHPKLVVAFHTMGHSRRAWLHDRVVRLIQRDVTGYVTVSNGQRDYFAEKLRLPREKIEVIYVGIDSERFRASKYEHEVRSELGIPQSAKVVGMLAMLRPEKNHEMFLRMARSVRARGNVYFLIVGGGPERERLEALAAEMGIADIVKFLGARSDTPEVLRAFDISVLSSRFEAMPQSLQESMSMELPVISTSVGSIAGEMVVDGVTGYITPEGDTDTFTEKVLDLLDNPEKARAMGRAGRRRVEEHFTRELMVRHFEDYFIRLCRQPNA